MKYNCLNSNDECFEMFVFNADTNVTSCRGERFRTEIMTLTASSGTIVSPGYDNQTYPNYATCQWIITAPPGKVRHVINSVARMEQIVVNNSRIFKSSFPIVYKKLSYCLETGRQQCISL